ncbi:exosortase C-terminal domain/associated protein EpsI [Desulfobulbus alkaliphilus]|uniref:exosortase C-terminal domain/associated protein EpsI n=1 Tax=Desulfobulbus alkaliphilus TaxID=869814 RepID=UPI0019664930|nr:exosortase C-terminal domain/associated protein EpsI [Desulfobulbus alkaliphilus]MBM9538160.1 EpsI family protein [Desulfobulbus alkaliphilus]
MKISPLRCFVVLLLIAACFFLLRDVTGTHRTPIKQSLAYFPATLGEWQAVASRQSSQAVIDMLKVDDYIEYDYVGPAGPPVNFYAAFYESVGTGGGYHSPRNCIPGGGWGIDSVRTVEIIPAGSSEPVRVTEMIIRNRNEYQVVTFWYQNRGRIIHSEYWEKIYQVLDAILLKRRDGTFVRLLAPAPEGDIEEAAATLRRFAALAITELDNYLPGR